MNKLTSVLILTAAITLPARADVITTGLVTPDPLTDGASVRVGLGGAGTLEVNGGSNVSTGTEDGKIIFVGVLDGGVEGSGEVLVTGAGSMLETYDFTAGINGEAHVSIEGGGRLNVADDFILNNGNDTGNSVRITGQNTLMTVGNTLALNNGSSLMKLAVDDHATLSLTGSHYLELAGTPGSIAQISVTNGATLENPSGKVVAYLGESAGAQGTLDVASGGMVNLGGFQVGRAGGAGNINVDGGSIVSAGKLILADSFGAAGTTGTLDIRGGGTVTSGDVFLLGNGGSTVATVHLDQGGSIVSTGDLRIGGGANGTGVLTLEGASSVTSKHYLLVGYAGGSTGTLVVDGGSSVTTSSLFGIGNLGGSAGSVTVDGGSTMDIGGMLQIGIYPGSAGTLNVADGSIDVGKGLVVGLKGTANLYIAAGSSITVPVNGVIFANAASSQAVVDFGLGHDEAGDPTAGLITAYQLLIRSGVSTLNLSFDPGETFTPGDVFTLIDYDSTYWNGGTFNNVGDDQLLTVGGTSFRINYDDLIAPGDYALTATVVSGVTAVPLPTAAWGGMVLLGAMGGFAGLKRKLRRA